MIASCELFWQVRRVTWYFLEPGGTRCSQHVNQAPQLFYEKNTPNSSPGSAVAAWNCVPAFDLQGAESALLSELLSTGQAGFPTNRPHMVYTTQPLPHQPRSHSGSPATNQGQHRR
jgi:hypothetical protein